jgi:hypothetical protein
MLEVKKENKLSPFALKKPSTDLIDQADILIPKLLIMQGLSEFVAQEKAVMGDIVNSVTGEVLGGKGKPISFIPLMMNKVWIKYKIQGGEQKYVGTIPWSAANSNTKWEDVDKDGALLRNDACLNFYVMLERDLESSSGLPYLVSFRRSSYRNGKKLVTHFAQTQMANVSPYAMTLSLTSSKEQNDKGTFYIFDIMPGKDTDAKYCDKLELWTETLKKNMHNIDETAEDTEIIKEQTVSII